MSLIRSTLEQPVQVVGLVLDDAGAKPENSRRTFLPSNDTASRVTFSALGTKPRNPGMLRQPSQSKTSPREWATMWGLRKASAHSDRPAVA
jgi:hypothetical protein